MLAAVAALAGCFSPYEPACGFICGSDGACPADYTCASDNVCHRNGTPADMQCTSPAPEFDVSAAIAVSNSAVQVTFNGVPNAALAKDPSNYSIEGLALTGDVITAANTVTLGTVSQQPMTYTLMVANVHRLVDQQPLTVHTATFTGRMEFGISSAASIDATHVTVTFDGPPDATAAVTSGNYTIASATTSLAVTAATLAGNVVTLTTDPQAELSYTLVASNIVRANDGEHLGNFSARFAMYCIDGALDVDETDLDCGGPTCTARCASAQMCMQDSDCAAGTCPSQLCVP